MCHTSGHSHHLQFTKPHRRQNIKEGFQENRGKYPFPYVYIHNFEGSTEDISKKGQQILTTLYIDANGSIRGVEGQLMAERTQIMDKQETMDIVNILMENIEKLQNDYDILLKEYNELKKKVG